MAPGTKRKRGSADGPDGSNRPSPHRPENLPLANHRASSGQYGNSHHGPQSPSYSHHGGRGGRGGSGGRPNRGGRGGGPAPHSTHTSSNSNTNSSATAANNAPDTRPPSDSTAISTHPDEKQASTPTPATVSSASAQPENLPPPQPMPYTYEIITNDRVEKWKDGGRNEALAFVIQEFNTKLHHNICVVFQEILRAGFDARIDPVDAGKLVAEALADAPEVTRDYDDPDSFTFPEVFLDTLSVVTEAEPPNSRIKPLVLATGISASLMREILEIPLLQTLGLIRPTFDRMFIRKQTNILYKQSNYNLLREETEGYSKLVTELFTTSNNQAPTAEIVRDTFEIIKALIGAFDLDAGRVLDVILDLFATLLVKQYRFFVKLLRASSWWPVDQTHGFFTQSQGFDSLPSWADPGHSHWLSTDDEKARVAALKQERDCRFWDRVRQVGMDAFFELGGRKLASDAEIAQLDSDEQESADVRTKETREWIKTTKTLPPPGNSVAAQLLGFKLRFYASQARDAHDSLPVNLIYLAALLIKIGFISLRDLYPHLYPEDDALKGMKEKLLREKEEREAAKRPGGGSHNALSRAGALSDDTLLQPVTRLRESNTRATTPSKSDISATKGEASTAKPEEEAVEQLPEPADQKVQLLRSLLCIGAIPEALYILGRFPWLVEAFPDLADYIHRILHHSLSKVYEPLRPMSNVDGIRSPAQIPTVDQSGLAKGEVRLQDPPATKILRWAQLDKMELSEGVEYRFYWDDWADNVPVCQNIDDMFTLCNSFLNISGVRIGQDPTLLVKLVRIGRNSLMQDDSELNRSRWLDLVKRLLVPALSLTKTNPGVVNEVFDLLKLYSMPVRYSVYNEWFLGSTSRLPDIKNAFDLARSQTRDTMRRMTKENQRQMARVLAKVACGSPGVVFQVIFNQIESYSNMIDVVVECGRYFTDMSYDILIWTLLSSLSRAGRSRVSQKNGINVSQWLSSLSQFAGKVCKRYSIVRPLPILQYVLQQLRLDNFADLQILKELIVNMAGIVPDTDFTDAQVQAMAGGDLLQGQILRQVQDRRHESKAPGRRLMKTIVDHDLTGALLVAIAQQRQMCVFNDNLTQIKAMSENFDNVHIVLTQYIDLLRHNLHVKEFDMLVPNLCSLISDFGIEPSVAFMAHRKSIVKAIEDYDAAHPPEKISNSDNTNVKNIADSTPSVTKADTASEDVEMTEASETATAVASADATQDSQAKAEPMEVTPATDSQIKGEIRLDEEDKGPPAFEWHPVLQAIVDRIRDVLPKDFEKSMSLPFYVSFWQLALNDLTLPTSSYNDEISRQKDHINSINADRSDVSAAGSRKKEAEKKAINDFLGRLTVEMKASVTKHSNVRQRLDKEKQHWFAGFVGNEATLINSLIQDCFLPRMLMSPLDSQYAWRMFYMLHSSGAPGFSTKEFLERLFNEKFFSNVLLHFTSREAENFGRFLNEVFKELGTWHTSKTEYEKKAYGPKKTLPGFAQAVTDDGKPTEFLEFEKFRNRMYLWHANVCNAIKTALNVDEYVHIRNACIVLKAIVKHFPTVNWMGSQIATILESISTSEGKKSPDTRRNDIWVLSTSVLGNLKARQKHWVLPQAFHNANNNQRAASRQVSSAPKSPLADASSNFKPLNAEAVPFEPKASPSETATTPAQGKADVEDGELEDTVMTGVESTDKSTAEAMEVTTTNPTATEEADTMHTSATKPDVEEMRARVKASADAKRRQSQPAVEDGKPTINEHGIDDGRNFVDVEKRSTPAANEAEANSSKEGSRAASAAPTRPDVKRENSAPGPHDRQRHALPNRPEVSATQTRYQQRQQNGPYGNRNDRPDSRGRLGPESQRPDPKQNERSGPPFNRQDISGTSRYNDTNRQGERDGRLTPSETRRPGGRELRGSNPTGGPPDRTDARDGGARPDTYGQSGQQNSKSTPSAPSAATESGPAINPERAALIEQSDPPARSEHPRDRGQRSRPQSPTRDNRAGGPHSQRNDTRRDGRSDAPRSIPHEPRPPHSDHPTDHAPDGPRSGPNSRHNRGGDGSRNPDLMQPPPSRTAHDRSQGRYGQESSNRAPHRDENYGRLNADSGPPQNGQPQGPSQPRNQRNVNGSMQPPRRQSTTQNQPNPTPAKDRQPHPRANGDQRNAPESSSGPPTPAAETQTQDLEGIHPSRLEQFTGPPTPAAEESRSSQQPQQSSTSSSRPPPGPRSSHPRNSETTASPAPRNAPAGPASANERRRGEGPARRQFADVQQTLSSGGPGSASNTQSEQGTSIRGRATAGRQQGPPYPEDTRHTRAAPDRQSDAPGKDLMSTRERGGPEDQSQNSRQYRQRDRPERPDRPKETRPTRGPGPSSSTNADRDRERDRERERSPQREPRHRNERDPREHERERRDGPGAARERAGTSGPPPSGSRGGRRGGDRESRELIGAPGGAPGAGAGRGAPNEGRKRGWSGEEGEGSMNKRPRRGGYNH